MCVRVCLCMCVYVYVCVCRYAGGRCVADKDDGSKRCLCAAGYVGPRCEDDIDECLTYPCANGAACTDLVNDFRCTCTSGFTGRHCTEKATDGCVDRPCQNGGSCTSTTAEVPTKRTSSFNAGVGFVCRCLDGYGGRRCEIGLRRHPSVTSGAIVTAGGGGGGGGSGGVQPTPPWNFWDNANSTSGRREHQTDGNGLGGGGSARRVIARGRVATPWEDDVNHPGPADQYRLQPLTVNQLAFVVGLGVSVPVSVIAIVAIFLTWRRRRRNGGGRRQRRQRCVENARNDASNSPSAGCATMNNRIVAGPKATVSSCCSTSTAGSKSSTPLKVTNIDKMSRNQTGSRPGSCGSIYNVLSPSSSLSSPLKLNLPQSRASCNSVVGADINVFESRDVATYNRSSRDLVDCLEEPHSVNLVVEADFCGTHRDSNAYQGCVETIAT